MASDFERSDNSVRAEPYIIGITGGIGSGKSVVSRILRLNGFSVYDCDTEAKRLMETDRNLIYSLVDILGPDSYKECPDRAGRIFLNRGYIAERIFNDDNLRLKVNEVVHKAVAADFIGFATTKGGLVFCESAILATSSMDSLCMQIWIISAPEKERIARIKIRNSMSESEIRRRIDSQAEEFNRLPKDKIRIIYNGSSDLLLPQIYEDLNKEKICLEKF